MPKEFYSVQQLNVGQELLVPLNSSSNDSPRDSVLATNTFPSTSVTIQQPEDQPYGPWIVVERRKKKPGPKGKNTGTHSGGKQKEPPSTASQPMIGKTVSNADPIDDPTRQNKPKGKDKQPSNQPSTSNGQKSITINAFHP
ncbi:hypothetical protein SLA2020_312240 [Shorea laevis]